MGKNQSKDNTKKHLQEERQHSRYNNNDLQEANQKISSLQQEILQLRQNNSKNVQQLNNSNNDLNRVNQKILDLTQEINSLRQLNNNLQMENTELKQNVQNLQNQILNTPQINGVVVPILKDINQIKKITINEEVKHEQNIQLHQDNKKMPQNLLEKNQQFQLDIQNSRKNIQQYNNYELNEIIQYLQHLDIKEFNKMHQQLEQLLQAREKKNTQIVQLDELQEAQLKDVILHFRKFLDNLNQIEIEDFLSERVRYEQEASLIIQQPIEAQTDLAQIMQIFTEALEELQQIDKFYHEYIHIMLTTMQNAKSKKYSIFKIAKQGFSSQKPAIDLTSNPKTLLLAIVQDYLITQLTRTENSVYYNDYKLPITLKNQDVLDASAIDYKLFTMKDNLPVIFFISLFSKNVMVLKFAENFEGKNKKLLLGEIFPEDMVQILGKFIKGKQTAAILMPYLQILLEEIQMPGLGFKQSKAYFNAFVEFVNYQMKKGLYIGYRHRDFKPANIAIKKNRDGTIQKLIYIDTDDGKLIKIDDNISWVQSNLDSFGITLPYVGPNFFLMYDLIYNNKELNTKQNFLINIEDKINKSINIKFAEFLKQIKYSIENQNEYQFNGHNKMKVVQRSDGMLVEYIYDIDACVWPQVVRTAIEILVKGYNNRLIFLGQRNEMKIEQKLDQYLSDINKGNQVFIDKLTQEILKDGKNLFQLAEAIDDEEINDFVRLLSQLLPLFKEEFNVNKFQQIFTQLEQNIKKENVLIDCFRSNYEQEFIAANKIEFLEDIQNLFVRCKGKRSRTDLYIFDLQEAVDNFITKSKNQVLLISGESGGGKSVFVDQYQKKIWESSEIEKFGIPIRIKLLTLKDPVKNLVGETFQKAGIAREKIAELRKSRLLFILDGYDELSNDKKRNLYKTNSLDQFLNCKVLITCRDTELKQSYKDLFEPAKDRGLEEIYVSPFDDDQVNEYLKKYIIHRPKDEKIAWSFDQYKQSIDQINGAKQLVTSPILLKITAQVLPGIVNEQQTQNTEFKTFQEITKIKLYKEFIDKWFERQKQKLITEGEPTEGIIEEYWHYAQKLASQMYTDQVLEFSYYQKTKNIQICYFDSVFQDQEEYPPIMKTKAFHALPIKRNQGSNYSFWHSSFLYFFYTQSIIQKKNFNNEEQWYYSVKQVNDFIKQAQNIILSIEFNNNNINFNEYFQQKYNPTQCVEVLKIVLNHLMQFNEKLIQVVNKNQLVEINQENTLQEAQKQQKIITTQKVEEMISQYQKQYPNVEIKVKYHSLMQLNNSINDQHIIAQTAQINENQIEIRICEDLLEQEQIGILEEILLYELSLRIQQALRIKEFNQTYSGYLEIGMRSAMQLIQQNSEIFKLIPFAVQIYEYIEKIYQNNQYKDENEINIQEDEEIICIQSQQTVQEKLRVLELNIQNMIKKKQKQLMDKEMEDLTNFIPLQCSTYFNAPHSFELMKKVEEYLEGDSQLKVLILMGDSGSGKTSFVENLTLERNNKQNKQEIALYISLPSINNTEQILQEFFLKNELSEQEIEELKETQNFLFIFDGYDELVQCFNIYDSNELNLWKSRCIIVSRTQQFAKFQNGCENYLYPHNQGKTLRNLVKELYIKPFTDDQRLEYINYYVKNQNQCIDWNSEKYEQEIKINCLEELVQTPFSLKLTLRALPKIIKQAQEEQKQNNLQIRLSTIYEIFMKDWFERELIKYEEKNQIKLTQHEKQLKIQQWSCYAIELAVQMLQNGLTEISYQAKRDRKSPQDEEWGKYFDPKEEERKWCLRACPLMVRTGQKQEKTWKFLHKSLQDYFVSINLNLDIKDNRQQKQTQNEIAYQSFKQGINMKLDENCLSFMVDALIDKQISQEFLFKIIYESRQNDKVQLAAANSITILNFAKFCFSGMDLSYIQIPGANLEQCVMDYTNLEGANLSNVNFKYAWLGNSNLSNSNMDQVEFGEYPLIQDHIGPVKRVLISYDEEYLITSVDLLIRVYEFQKKKLLFILQHSYQIQNIDLSSNENKLISCSNESCNSSEIRIWNVKTGQLIQKILQKDRKELISGKTHIQNSIYSPNGKQIALVEISNDYSNQNLPESTKIHVLDAQNYSLLITLHLGISQENKIIYTTDSQKIIWVGTATHNLGGDFYIKQPQFIKIWNCNDGALLNTIDLQPDCNISIACLSDGNTIILGDGLFYNIQTSELIKNIDKQTFGTKILFSPDQKIIASNFGTYISLIDAVTFQQIDIVANDSNSNDLCFTQDGKRLLTAAQDGTVRFWKLKNYKHINNIKRKPQKINQIKHSNNGQFFCLAINQSLQIRNAQNYKLIFTIQEQSNINNFQFSYDDQQIVIHVELQIKFYEVKSGKLLKKQLQQGFQNYQNMYIENTKNIIVDSILYENTFESLNYNLPQYHKYPKQFQIWDTESFNIQSRIESKMFFVNFVEISRNGKFAAFAGYNFFYYNDVEYIAEIWDLKLQICLFELCHEYFIAGIKFCLQRQYIVSATDDNIFHLWDIKNGKLLQILNLSEKYTKNKIFSPQNLQYSKLCGKNKLFSSFDDEKIAYFDSQIIYLFDLKLGFQPQQLYTISHNSGDLIFTSNGKHILVGNASFLQSQSLIQIQIWDTETRDEITQLWGVFEDKRSVSLSPNDDQLIFGGNNGLFYIYEQQNFNNKIFWMLRHIHTEIAHPLIMQNCNINNLKNISDSNLQLLQHKGTIGYHQNENEDNQLKSSNYLFNTQATLNFKSLEILDLKSIDLFIIDVTNLTHELLKEIQDVLCPTNQQQNILLKKKIISIRIGISSISEFYFAKRRRDVIQHSKPYIQLDHFLNGIQWNKMLILTKDITKFQIAYQENEQVSISKSDNEFQIIQITKNLSNLFSQEEKEEDENLSDDLVSKQVDTFKKQSLLLMQQHKYNEALSLYKKQIFNLSICVKLGNLHLKLKNFKESIQYFQLALQQNPDKTDALYKLGLIYQQNNELQTAKQHFIQVFQLNKDPQILNNTIKIFLHFNEYDLLQDYIYQLTVDCRSPIVVFEFIIFMFHYKKRYDLVKSYTDVVINKLGENANFEKYYLQIKESKHYEDVLAQLFGEKEEICFFVSTLLYYIRIMSAYYLLDLDYLQNSYKTFKKILQKLSDQSNYSLFNNIQKLLLDTGMLHIQNTVSNVNDEDVVEQINNFWYLDKQQQNDDQNDDEEEKEKEQFKKNNNNADLKKENQQININEDSKSNQFQFKKQSNNQIKQIKEQQQKLNTQIQQDIAFFKQLFDAKRYEQAIQVGNDIINLFPQNLNIYFFIAKIYENLQKYNKALEIYEQIIDLEPKKAVSYVNSAIIYHKYLNNFQKAEQYYTKSISLDQNAKALQNLGSLYLISENIEQAELCLTEAVKLHPQSQNICELSLFLLNQKQNYQELFIYVERIFSSVEHKKNFTEQKLFYTTNDKKLLGEDLFKLFFQQQNKVEVTVGSLMHYIRIMNYYYLGYYKDIKKLLLQFQNYKEIDDKDKNTANLFQITYEFIQQKQEVQIDNLQGDEIQFFQKLFQGFKIFSQLNQENPLLEKYQYQQYNMLNFFQSIILDHQDNNEYQQPNKQIISSDSSQENTIQEIQQNQSQVLFQPLLFDNDENQQSNQQISQSESSQQNTIQQQEIQQNTNEPFLQPLVFDNQDNNQIQQSNRQISLSEAFQENMIQEIQQNQIQIQLQPQLFVNQVNNNENQQSNYQFSSYESFQQNTIQQQEIQQNKIEDLLQPLIFDNQVNNEIQEPKYCCNCCTLFFCENISQIVYSELQSLILYFKSPISTYPKYQISDNLQNKNNILDFFLQNLESISQEYDIQVQILNYKLFQSKLSSIGRSHIREIRFQKNSIKAFTYKEPFSKIIHVIFCKGMISTQILNHELRRIRQILEEDHQLLRSYFEEIEEIMQQQSINNKEIQSLLKNKKFQIKWQSIKHMLINYFQKDECCSVTQI